MRDILRRLLGWKASPSAAITEELDIPYFVVPAHERVRRMGPRGNLYRVER